MIQQNQIFSFQRFGRLINREARLNSGTYLISISGAFALMLIITAITAFSMNRQFEPEPYFALFLVFMIAYGVMFMGNSFPYFRNKERTMDYLLIPNSQLEKFVFEVLSRLILFAIIYPVLFWLSFNISVSLANAFHPRGVVQTISIPGIIQFMIKDGVESIRGVFLMFSGIAMGFSIFFMGSAFFKKIPLVKTASAIIILMFGSFLYGYLINLIIRFTDGPKRDMSHISEELGMNLTSAFFLVSMVTFLIISFLRLREKEV